MQGRRNLRKARPAIGRQRPKYSPQVYGVTKNFQSGLDNILTFNLIAVIITHPDECVWLEAGTAIKIISGKIQNIIFRSGFMAAASKNARVTAGTHKFACPCGGEVKMRSVFSGGKMRHFAYCAKCKREERRHRDFN
ncbi:MAG: hypothetical protein B0D92_01890 [Spirochaeta sp. LUC14_002_19_P3]|nr:MAG: hypothetical protein B0D92_01890 [Spirochaeta sp. LUC14_002_19_P3]